MQGWRRVKGREFAVLAWTVAALLALTGCSPGADYPSGYPSIFPAVHDMPPPRAENTMDPDQVQQATEALISDRNHLSAEAKSSSQDNPAPPPVAPKKPVAAKPTAAAGAPASATAGTTQTAGAESKP